MSAPSPAFLVPPVRLGRLLREAREAHGETIPQLARRSGLAYDDRWFDDLEAGHVALDESMVRWASALYGVGASEVVPARSQLVIDLDEGVIAVGARRTPLVGNAPGAPGFDQVLGNYLALVYLLRDLPPGTPIPMREVDVTVLAQALQRDRREVRIGLGRLISTDGDALVQRSSSLRRRVIVPVAGILVGLTAVGGLLLVRATDSDARVEEEPATMEGPAVTARDVPIDIGDAVLLERGEAQTTR